MLVVPLADSALNDRTSQKTQECSESPKSLYDTGFRSLILFLFFITLPLC